MTSLKDARAAFAEGFLGVDAAKLAEMPDVELAQWQAGFPSDSAQYVLADREWQRRMIGHQLTVQYKLEEQVAKVNRWWSMGAAVVGVVGTLAGVWLGLFLSKSSPSTAEPSSAVLRSATKAPAEQSAASQALPSGSNASQALRPAQAAANK